MRVVVLALAFIVVASAPVEHAKRSPVHKVARASVLNQKQASHAAPEAAALAAVTAADTSAPTPQPCICPTMVRDELNNNNCFGDECGKVINLPACCNKKMTPGPKCSNYSTCQGCTNLGFCRWRNASPAGCISVADVLELSDYIVSKCDATLTGQPAYLPLPPPDKLPGLGAAAANFNQTPKIVDGKDWPLFTNGYLGPGCRTLPQILSIDANPKIPDCPKSYTAALIEE